MRTLDGLRDQIALISAGSWARTASWRREASEHARILEVARSGDSEGAARLVREHVTDFARRRIAPTTRESTEGGSL